MPFFSFTVPQTYTASERLDTYIAALQNGMNRSKLKSGVTTILVNGKPQKLSYRPKAGDGVDIQWEEGIPAAITPEDIPLSILYEDDAVCVVNKAQGMVTHPASGNWTGTLVNALLYHWGRGDITCLSHGTMSDMLRVRRPGIVHRLDKETSGVIVTAKNRGAEEWLQAQFRNHRALVKEYIAICTGRPQHQHGVVRTQLVRDPKNRKRFKAVAGGEDGKEAVSAYRCIACYGEYSLLKIRIATGRTHQIRVQLKYLNCPVLGDGLYGHSDKLFPGATLMLHSKRLSIRLPGKKKADTFVAPTPERFLQVLHRLRALYPKTVLPKDR
ncbi:MAG: RluA family pseudouridine synthase [Treponema sp.]|nr:RluA family pseudouridine synthase [Treponema sp.]